ncbi:nucleotidyltransferase family protein [Limnoglobus roseus]|uniref:Nucleotidyltransferase family protein n=1 Tax=Limnoglobus roseus TaxID=2598579 RepID=A0A5C1AIT9_9BACT|nr:hypothetical protein [Limnoglobus roseus]QEL16888.1 hypothetical protein PX52LOC_03863 [Limnoglobus roseus]
MHASTFYPDTIDRMERAVNQVKLRLRKAVEALEAGGVPYAVVGGNAVAAWVTQVDPGSERFTRDVDILIDRDRLPAVIAVMEAVGFEYANTSGVDPFIEKPDGRPSDGVHLLYAGEKVKAEYGTTAPTMAETERGPEFQVVSLEALVRMKLESNRRKDQLHLDDMIGVGLIDQTWTNRFPPYLAERLQHLLDTPDG